MKDRLLFTAKILWTVAFSVTLTVFLSIPLFALDIGWEKLTEIAHLSNMRLMHNYLVLMEYLLNPFRAHLKMPDFLDSASALKHFSEVKGLFLVTLALTLLLIPFVLKFYRQHVQVLFRRGIVIAMLVPLFLAILAATIGFDSFFILFHRILFRDNTWLFNPNTDPIINILTDSFFMYCFIIFAIIYESTLAVSLRFGRFHGKQKSQKQKH